MCRHPRLPRINHRTAWLFLRLPATGSLGGTNWHLSASLQRSRSVLAVNRNPPPPPPRHHKHKFHITADIFYRARDHSKTHALFFGQIPSLSCHVLPCPVLSCALNSVRCLNESSAGGALNCLKAWDKRRDPLPRLESEEDDPELIIFVPFTQVGGSRGEAKTRRR